jgi:hypothetical protein
MQGQLSTPSSFLTSYAPPSLRVVTPLAPMTTSGGVAVRLQGSNFGASATDVVVLQDGAVVSVVSISVPHVEVRFVTLPTALSVATFVVAVAGQGLPAPVPLPIMAPTVVGLDIDVTWVAPADAVDTFFVMIRGASFGIDGGRVTIEASACEYVSWTHVSINCIATVRLGTLVVAAGSRVSAGVLLNVDQILQKPAILDATPFRVPTAVRWWQLRLARALVSLLTGAFVFVCVLLCAHREVRC